MRILPLILIGGTAFYVDVMEELFREYGNPDNTISFKHLQGDGDHYVLEFDKRTKNIKQQYEINGAEYIITTRVPPIVKLDPVGLAKKFNKPLRTFMYMKDDTEW